MRETCNRKHETVDEKEKWNIMPFVADDIMVFNLCSSVIEFSLLTNLALAVVVVVSLIVSI